MSSIITFSPQILLLLFIGADDVQIGGECLIIGLAVGGAVFILLLLILTVVIIVLASYYSKLLIESGPSKLTGIYLYIRCML